MRDRYNLRDDVVIGFIGTFGKWHGADVLAKAYGRLLTARPDLHFRLRLLMIGDGPGRAAAEAVLVQADLADRAVFTGLVPQDQGPAHLAACDILASPHVPNPDGTPFFGSPTKLFEYMARAKPIVASELDQIGQILQAGKTALMVPPGDEGALADALGTLVDNPDLRVRLGCGAREVVVAKYDWRAHTQRILAALAPAAA
ncbi:MAG: glycosyltransferase [Ferrovibrio sp.]